MVSYRIVFWFPTAIFFILNMTFKLVIFLLQHIGNAIVWCNRKFVKAGDYFTDLAKNDDGLDNWIEELKKSTEETKKQVKAKRKNK